MANVYRALRVAVASASDLKEERRRLDSIISQLNNTVAHSLGLNLELWRWEADALPGLGEPQDLINPEVDKADFLIVLLWNRFGTPTSRAGSGTAEEFERAFTRWKESGRPEVMVYCCQSPSNLKSVDELEQKRKVLEFRARLEQIAIVIDYTTVEEFEARVFRHLANKLQGDGKPSWLASTLPSPSLPIDRETMPQWFYELGRTARRIITEKPWGWEAHLLTQVICDELAAAAGLKRDLEYGVVLGPSRGLWNAMELLAFMRDQNDAAIRIFHTISDLGKRGIPDAMAPQGVPGDPEKLAHVAKRLGAAYRAAIDWTMEWKRAAVPDECITLRDKSATMMADAIGELERLGRELRSQMDTAAAAVAAGLEPPVITITLDLDVPISAEELTAEMQDAIGRLRSKA